MIRELVILSVNGTRRDDLRNDLTEIEIEEDVESADVFRVRLAIAPQGNRTWRHLDDPDLAIWNRVAIRAGYPDNHELLIDGYVTHVDVALSGSGGEDSFVELSGGDASVLMDLEDKQVAWANKKDSDIAQEIFTSYGLSWEVEDTELLYSERLATTLQSDTDIRFLQLLAARNGFECFVRGGRGYFRTANLQEPPQKPITVPVGNAAALRFAIDGTPPTRLEISRLDPFEKREEREILAELPERQLAKRSLATLRGDSRVGRRLLRQPGVVSKQELRARLRAGYAAASGFVTASGELDGRSYGAVLRAKRLVTISGSGPSHDGHYYVTRVRHVLSGDSYVQSFVARRNAIGLLGTENFAAPPALAPITPSAGGSSTGNRLLPPQRAGLPSGTDSLTQGGS
jgi:phage protein D